uniref:Uncharacterized protein n=1 Tax=Pararge aegeria TaxID=116150 RepID=S4PTZ2_9NEOP
MTPCFLSQSFSLLILHKNIFYILIDISYIAACVMDTTVTILTGRSVAETTFAENCLVGLVVIFDGQTKFRYCVLYKPGVTKCCYVVCYPSLGGYGSAI